MNTVTLHEHHVLVERLTRIHGRLSYQRATFWKSGEFGDADLEVARSYLTRLSNWREELLPQFAQAPPTEGELQLACIGWTPRALDSLSLGERVLICDQIADRLRAGAAAPSDLRDAHAVARTLPNPRDEWAAKFAPLEEFAKKAALLRAEAS